MKQILLLGFLLFGFCASGQKIDNTVSFRSIENQKYFRINYDNDFFAAQDKNYSQGYSFELVAPCLRKNPINKILFGFKKNSQSFGLTFEHLGFTPDRYELPEIQFGDRPFASVAMLKSFVTSTNYLSKIRLSSHFSFGVMGPAALGKQIQAGIHSLTGDREPLGWENQIENHLVLNYGVDIEKEIFKRKDNLSISGNAAIKIGNLYTNATVGSTATFGLVNNPYQSKSSRNFLIYAFVQPLVGVVLFDGTLQGDIINDQSAYTISSTDVTRVVGQINYGIVIQTRTFYLEYLRTNISNEINNVGSAAWGGVKVGFRL